VEMEQHWASWQI